jgi:NADH-quinone oxidoreductase subunit A
MAGASSQAVLYIVAATAAAVAFVGLVFGVNILLSPRNPTPEKVEPYECGMVPAGDPHAPIRIRYATIAVLFVIFDAESVMLFAVATRLHGSIAGAIAVGAFVSLVAFGLLVAWRKGALAWRS